MFTCFIFRNKNQFIRVRKCLENKNQLTQVISSHEFKYSLDSSVNIKEQVSLMTFTLGKAENVYLA